MILAQDILRDISEREGWDTDTQIIALAWFIAAVIDQSQHPALTLEDFRLHLERHAHDLRWH